MSETLILSNSLSYRHFKKSLLSDITFRLNSGEILVVTGPPGCGKSLFVEILTGIKKNTAGNLIILDKIVDVKHPIESFEIFCSWSTLALYQNMSILDNLKFFSSLYGIQWSLAKKIVLNLLDSFNLTNKIRQYIATLSPGDQKKVDLCRVLIKKPKILILDEPLLLLDSKSKEFFLKKLKSLKAEGVGIVIATSDIGPFEKILDKVIVLKNGHVLANQASSKLLERREQVLVLKPINIVKTEMLKLPFVKDIKRLDSLYHLRLKKNIELSKVVKYFEERKIKLEMVALKQTSIKMIVEEILKNA